MEADIIIVGAGIAGLRCGIEILHKRPKSTVVILEKYGYTGGRITTFKRTLSDDDGSSIALQWENGAGRIAADHKKIHALVKHYGLTLIPLDTTQRFIRRNESDSSENTFEDTMSGLVPLLKQLSPDILAENTLEQLLYKILGAEKARDLLDQFPYRSEVTTLRADLGIKSFENEMGSYEGYTVVKEGLSALTKAMAADFVSLGGTIFNKHAVTDIQESGAKVTVIAQLMDTQVLWTAPTVILALHRDALKEVPAMKRFSLLDKVKMEPLVRIYAVFPVEENHCWFEDLSRVVTPRPVRYIIPYNPKNGSIMISYTDGRDARHILKMLDSADGEAAIEAMIMKEIRELFPSRTIPDPLFFKIHPWYSGCSYWLPGRYDPVKASIDALHPLPSELPGVYVCGESFSTRQAWMEGAVEHADLLLEKYAF